MKGFKMVAYGIILVLLSVFSSEEMRQFFAEHLPWIGSSAGAIVIVLRAITSTPIFKKE